MLRAIIFDFDGLIVDTETPDVETWREVFLEYGTTFPDAYWKSAIGRGAEQIFETPIQLLARSIDAPIDEEAVRVNHHRRVHARINAQPVRPGILKLLTEADRAELRVGVASSSRHAWVDGHLSRLGILDRFQVTTCADDVARAKPFPDLYLAACERLGVLPAEAIAIEDSPNGVAAARAAGVFVVAYPNELTRHLDLAAANRIVPQLERCSLEELRTWHKTAP